MSQMTGITNANQALAAEDLEGDLFEVVGGKIRVRQYKPVNGLNPPGSAGLVPLADLITPTDLLEPGDQAGAPINQAYQMLRADGTWGTQNIFVNTQAANTVSANQPTPNNSGGTAYPAYAGQQFYSPYVTVDLVGSGGTKNSPIPIPYYPSVTAPTTTPIAAGGMLPSAKTLAGRADVVFTSDGQWRVLPTAPAPTNTLVYDAIGKTITSTVSGVVSTTSLASLDDEGVSLSFAAGSLQLKNAAGTVLSTTPVPDLDAQTLTLTGQTLAISGGNSVTLPAPPPVYSGSVAGIVPAAPAAPLAGKFLQADGTWATPPAPTATTNTLTATFNGGSVPNLTSTVNGVAAVLPLPRGPILGTIGFDQNGLISWSAEPGYSDTSAPTYDPIANPVSPRAGVRLTLNGPQTVTLPTPAVWRNTVGNTGAFTITNPTATAKTLSLPVTGLDGIPTTTLPPFSSFTIHGTDNNTWDVVDQYIPAAVPAPTTHVNAWTKAGGLTESVNSVASNIAIPVASPIGSMTDFIGYNATGTPVNTPVPRTVRIQEEYKAVAASTTHAIIGPNADALYDTYFISTLIEVTAAGVTYTLPVVPPTIGLAIHSIEIDVKTTGSWTGTVSVAAPAGVTIDGAAAYSFTKAAATGVNAQPSRSFRYSLSAGKWLVV